MERETFISEIASFAERTGQMPSTVCLRAVGNGHLFRRLNEGGDCSTRTMERVRRYIAENLPCETGAASQ